jgi:TorA maturation chaperone TorD/Pyruvate/2-oxoacid:ferredoxin oxidoreductase delta subunit
MNAVTARQRSATYALLAQGLSEAKPGLESEYTRLFLGPGRPVAHPYESVYRERRTMGDCTMDVQIRMTEEGLAPHGSMLPDHVSAELAFMAHLAAQEAAAWDAEDGETALAYLARQDSFLQDHLMAWLPQFCHRVLVGRPHRHYADLVQDAETFVTDDAAHVRAWRGDGSSTASAETEQARWAVTVGQECTLCGVCVQVCLPGALQLIQRDGTSVLHFQAAVCDGCAACERWCPEGVVSRERASKPPASGELIRSSLLSCPQCGRRHAPASLVARVRTHTGAESETALRRLTLCPDCKVIGITLPQRNRQEE